MRWFVLCVFLVSCGTFEEKPPDEGGFLKVMEEKFPSSNKQDNLDNGKSVCFKLRSGKTQDEVIMEKYDHGMTIENASLVTQLSIDYLCPVFK